MEKQKYYAIQQAGRSADIYIFGDLTSWPWKESDVSSYTLAREIQGLDADEINIHINSYGGEIAEGWAIYNALRESRARVTTYADGFVASAAIYPFMAGEARIASNLSAFFFHRGMTGAYGNAEELRKAADEIEKLTEIGLEAMRNAGIDAEKVREMETAETWLTAAEALDMGIATEVHAETEQKAPAQSVRRLILEKVMKRPEEKMTEPVPMPEPEQHNDKNALRDFVAGLF